MKFLFLMDSRATYSYSRNVLIHLKKRDNVKVLVTGNYLEKSFGVGLEQFKNDRIKINYKIPFKSPNQNRSSWSSSLGETIKKFSKKLEVINPNLVIVTGDRIETLAMTLAASYMNIPIAHIQAGDKSGHIDDISRAAIAKYAHIHFSSCRDSSRRLLKWGESDSRIFEYGAPQLDDIEKISKKNFLKKNYFVAIFHPVLDESKKLNLQMDNLINALNKFNQKVYWIYPNNDFSHELILRKLKKNNLSNIEIIKNLDRKDFIDLLSKCKLLIGNSSCGIIEAPSFGVPVINIGSRQNGRPQSKNIVNCSYNSKKIVSKINLAISKKFQIKCRNVKNIYFKKNAGFRIYKMLTKLKSNSNLLKKY